jgi:hypothetical protein
LPVATAGSTVIRSNSMENVLSHRTNDMTAEKSQPRQPDRKRAFLRCAGCKNRST